MPAIQLARLRQQAAGLGNFFLQPDIFIRQLHDLLDFYADRTRRPGQIGSRSPRLPHYNVAAPVLLQISAELEYRTGEIGPSAALDLVDCLWKDGCYETRLISVSLLGSEPIPPEAVIARLQAWAQPETDLPLLHLLLYRGKLSLDRSHPDDWLTQVKQWLADAEPAIQSIGLRALKITVDDPAFENLPVVFNLLGPIFQSAPPSIHAELAAVIETAAKKSPTETVFFLRQAISAAHDPRIPRLARRCLPLFDVENQAKLRAALVAHAIDR